eukprot:4520819-Pyramimonas_sp.AAC.1
MCIRDRWCNRRQYLHRQALDPHYHDEGDLRQGSDEAACLWMAQATESHGQAVSCGAGDL